MGRLMGLDFGSKTVGVALSDELKMIASPFETIVRDKESKIRPTLRRIVELAGEKEVEKIVLGLPLNMDDSIGFRAEKSMEFAELLRRRLADEGYDIPVVMWDERLSTVSADEVLEEAEIGKGDRKQYIDRIAAAFILEDYMNNGGNE